MQRQISELIDRDCIAKKDYAITVEDSSSSDSQNTSITDYDSGSELTADGVTKKVVILYIFCKFYNSILYIKLRINIILSDYYFSSM